MTQRPPAKSQTVAERIRLASTRLTPSEHKLAHALLANYPVAGLSSITEFAKAAKVSTASSMNFCEATTPDCVMFFDPCLEGRKSLRLSVL